jgi:hypothetical protein
MSFQLLQTNHWNFVIVAQIVVYYGNVKDWEYVAYANNII